jgi:hypothetical protein
VFETEVRDGTQQLWLQKEIPVVVWKDTNGNVGCATVIIAFESTEANRTAKTGAKTQI